MKSKNLIIVLLCRKDHLSFVRYLNLFNCIELLPSYAVIVLMRVCRLVASTLKVTYLFKLLVPEVHKIMSKSGSRIVLFIYTI